MKDLAGRIVLVTGAGRGIGKAIALAFGAEQSWVVITGRTAAALEEVAAMLRSTGAQVLARQCDVAQKPQVESLRHEIEKRFGAIEFS